MALAALAGLLVASPVRAQAPEDPGFARWLRSFGEEAKDKGIPAAVVDRALAGVTPDPDILLLIERQPELEKTVWEYLDRVVSDERIAKGREQLGANRALFDAIEGFYGVDRYTLAAIWGIESKFGESMGLRPVARSLATIAYAGGRRAGYGRTQLMAALRILAAGDVAPESMVGSWAGALGHTQFIPTTFLEHAVDFDRDGRRDVWGNLGDALASTARYLARSSWHNGEAWGYEVVVPPGLDLAQAGLQVKHPTGAWVKLGVRRQDGKAFPDPARPASLLLPAGARGPAFLVSANFRAILRYNNAVAYALAVSHLADRLRGGGPLAGSWPREERALAKAEREELQRLLAVLGYEIGEIDGVIGSQTRAALRSYQQQRGLPADGYPTIGLLERIRVDAPS